MVTYAPVPAFAERKRYPRALVVIVAGHAALIGAVMMAKMDLPSPIVIPPTMVELIPEPKDPPPEPPEPKAAAKPVQSAIDRPIALVPIPSDRAEPSPVPIPQPGPVIEPAPLPGPDVVAQPLPVRTGPRFATPDSQLRPPYPPLKQRLGEEATLRLRLSIDDRGRVTAVEPVGRADPAFLESARRHLTARWRYQPATEGGRPVASSTVITLKFELGD